MRMHLYLLALIVSALVMGLTSPVHSQGGHPDVGAEVAKEFEYALENFWTSEEGLESLHELEEGMDAEEMSETTEEIREFVGEHFSELTSSELGASVLLILVRKKPAG